MSPSAAGARALNTNSKLEVLPMKTAREAAQERQAQADAEKATKQREAKATPAQAAPEDIQALKRRLAELERANQN